MNSNSNINSFDFNNIVKQEKIENKFDDRFKMFLSTDVARFHWDIIMVCNQKCSYCYARQFDEWGNLNNLKMINSVLNKLKQIKKPIEVVLLGGEPTLSPYYKYICEEIYKLPNLNLFGCISNNKSDKFDDLLIFHSKFKNKFNWNITYHPADVDDINKFKSRLKIIRENNFILNVNIMLVSEKYKNEIIDMIDFCIENKINYYYNVLFNHHGKLEYLNYSQSYKNLLEFLNSKYKNYCKELKYTDINGNVFYTDDIGAYLNNLSIFKNWKCKNNNYDIGVNSDKIKKFCYWEEISVDEINNSECWMKCPLDMCLCQGKLTAIKLKDE